MIAKGPPRQILNERGFQVVGTIRGSPRLFIRVAQLPLLTCTA